MRLRPPRSTLTDPPFPYTTLFRSFFAGYSQLPRQVEGLAGAPAWPAIRALLPELSGKRIVDLGFGFGWFARWAREEGAAQVLGLDLSEKMIARARADTAAAAIAYRIYIGRAQCWESARHTGEISSGDVS